tara:strand:- start:371 stop:1489 length:1119 start_codon:yes stop_codon:yes gene_type:complete
MKQVGLNLSHDSSLCIVDKGETELFIEEERYSRIKHDGDPFHVLDKHFRGIDSEDYSNTYNLGMTGLLEDDNKGGNSLKVATETVNRTIAKILTYKGFDKWCDHSRKHAQTVIYNEHHFLHACCGFYNSGFDDAAIVVVDAMGNALKNNDRDVEVATTFIGGYPNTMVPIVGMSTPTYMACDSAEHKAGWNCGIGMAYSAVSSYLGFGGLGAGKVMGLAPYGKEDPNIKSFILDDGYTVDSNLFYRTRFGANFIPYDYLPPHVEAVNTEKHFQKLANLAWRLQEDFQTHMLFLLTDALERTNMRNLVLTGGCALNCVANYWYLDKLPKDVKLYVEPISNDAGVSLGLAKYLHYCETQSYKKHPLKNLYLGPK